MTKRQLAALGALLLSITSGAPVANAATSDSPCALYMTGGPRLISGKTKITGSAESWCPGKFTFKVTIQQYRGLGIWRNKATTTKRSPKKGKISATVTWKCAKGTGNQLYRIVSDATYDRGVYPGPASEEKRFTCPG